jgi:hypothetical protein
MLNILTINHNSITATDCNPAGAWHVPTFIETGALPQTDPPPKDPYHLFQNFQA